MMDDRDSFAMAAIQGLLAAEVDGWADASFHYWNKGDLLADKLARHAYMVADAMLKEREKNKPPLPKTP